MKRDRPIGIARVRRRVLIAHAFATALAGLVLVVRPEAIPAAVGIRLSPDAVLLSYLLAAAEWGFASLSWLGAQLQELAGIRVVMLACIVLHLTSCLLEAFVWMHAPDSSPVLAANVGVRLIIVAGFLWLVPRRPAAGTSLNGAV